MRAWRTGRGVRRALGRHDDAAGCSNSRISERTGRLRDRPAEGGHRRRLKAGFTGQSVDNMIVCEPPGLLRAPDALLIPVKRDGKYDRHRRQNCVDCICHSEPLSAALPSFGWAESATGPAFVLRATHREQGTCETSCCRDSRSGPHPSVIGALSGAIRNKRRPGYSSTSELVCLNLAIYNVLAVLHGRIDGVDRVRRVSRSVHRCVAPRLHIAALDVLDSHNGREPSGTFGIRVPMQWEFLMSKHEAHTLCIR